MSAYSGLTASDFAAALARLFPRGPAWPREPGTVQDNWRRAVGDFIGAMHAADTNLLDNELFPDTTDVLLPDWELEFGLPDPCSPLDLTIDQRRQALIARITDEGGLSRQHYIDLAASIGVTITIDEFRPWSVDSAVDLPLYSELWRFVWRTNSPEFAKITELTCVDPCDGALRSWGDAELECVIQSHNRPSRIVFFAYTGTGDAMLDFSDTTKSGYLAALGL